MARVDDVAAAVLERTGAPSTAPISTTTIRDFYRRQVADIETAVTNAAANAALEGVLLDDEWQDQLRDVAEGRIGADDRVAEEIARIIRG
jgi:hypothetical protein